MNTFQIIKSKFLFLEEEYNLERIKKEKTEITRFDYQFEVVHYVNDFVLIEIGGGEGLVGGYLIRVEVRRVEKGIPVSYNDLVEQSI